jgi:uncharacterized oxidoreductase
MKLTGNTIFITGGGSGIGRGLAEAFHKLGNQVVISGRRKGALDETTKANPGMESVELDVADPESVAAVARDLSARFPQLNVLINNAGVMQTDHVGDVIDDAQVSSIVDINLLGPIRMTSALIEHLKTQPVATVMHVTSGLAFSPLASNATYCATKAALHSFALSQRYLLRDSSVRVLEIAPPYVQTELTGEHQKTDPKAMPLDAFIKETMDVLSTDAVDVLVESVKPRRSNPRRDDAAFVAEFNQMMGR